MKKNIYIWTLAIILTFASAIYQRLTGPTHPQIAQINFNGKLYKQKFIRSHGGNDNAVIQINLPEHANLNLILYYKLFPGNFEWKKTQMEFKNGKWQAQLPHLPPAGKYQYYIKVLNGNIPIYTNSTSPVTIRFKGAVPTWILIIHVLFMFTAMLFSNATGFMVLFKHSKQKQYAILTLILLFIGGMIMGPIVQKFAFDEFWTGIPKGWDLTDNKTLVAFIAWVIAVAGNWKKKHPAFILTAAVITLIIFAIPHSMFGSTLDPQTGKVTQGIILGAFAYRTGIKTLEQNTKNKTK